MPHDTEDSDSSDDEISDHIFDSNTVPMELEGVTKRREPLLKISELQDKVMKRLDNQVIFIDMSENPVCNGAREFHEADRLPKYCDLTYERAKVDAYGTKVIIIISIKVSNRIPISTENLKNSMRTLLDVAREIQLKSFSITITDYFDDINWSYFKKQLIRHFEDEKIHITICGGEIEYPRESERIKLIRENHSTLPGEGNATKADALAAQMRVVLREKGVRVTRAVKTTELRLVGLDPSITPGELVAAIARDGRRPADAVKLEEIRRRSPNSRALYGISAQSGLPGAWQTKGGSW